MTYNSILFLYIFECFTRIWITFMRQIVQYYYYFLETFNIIIYTTSI